MNSEDEMSITNNNEKTILVIDDEQGICDTLELILKQEGYGVHTVTSGSGALIWLRDKKADIVLLDIKMPDANGIDVLRDLRKQDKDTIVIILTAYSTISDAREAMQLGAYDFITKPFDMELVKTLVRESLLERSE